MKTSQLIALTATVVALAAPTASARPAAEPAGSQVSEPAASTQASIAAHHEQISNEQWQRSQAAAPVTALEDRTHDGRFPVVFVLAGLTVPLGIALVRFAVKPVMAYSRRRRAPARLA